MYLSVCLTDRSSLTCTLSILSRLIQCTLLPRYYWSGLTWKQAFKLSRFISVSGNVVLRSKGQRLRSVWLQNSDAKWVITQEHNVTERSYFVWIFLRHVQWCSLEVKRAKFNAQNIRHEMSRNYQEAHRPTVLAIADTFLFACLVNMYVWFA